MQPTVGIIIIVNERTASYEYIALGLWGSTIIVAIGGTHLLACWARDSKQSVGICDVMIIVSSVCVRVCHRTAAAVGLFMDGIVEVKRVLAAGKCKLFIILKALSGAHGRAPVCVCVCVCICRSCHGGVVLPATLWR